MTIDENILLSAGASQKNYEKDEMVFSEGSDPQYFYQIVSGSVKMVSDNEEAGKDFIQGFFHAGESFGEPPLFDGQPYPASAYAVGSGTVILRLRRDAFLELIKTQPGLHLALTTMIAKRLRFKSIMLREIACYPPQHRILTLFKYLKACQGMDEKERLKINFSRKEIACQTGLRVETVIRSILTLAEEGKLEIKNGKVYY